MKNKKIIGIVGGTGKMGQLFQNIFVKQGFTALVSGRQTDLTNQQLAQQSDIVIICVPIKDTVSVIEQVAPFLKSKALLMDFTSIKEQPLQAMLKAHSGPVLGCHPMFGPTKSLQNQKVILCPGRGQKELEIMQKVFEKEGMIVEIITAQKHDSLMSMIQGVTHFMSITLAYTLTKINLPITDLLRLQSPVYRFTLDFLGRILNQSPELYGSIQIDNPQSATAVEQYIQASQEIFKIIQKQDLTSFIQIFNQGKAYFGDFTRQAQKESDLIIDMFSIQSKNQQEIDFWHQQKTSGDVALLGPQKTYSDLAVKKYFAQKKLIYTKTIADAFELLQQDQVKIIVVPIDNSIEGSINETLDCLYKYDFWINYIYPFRIRHCLAVHPTYQGLPHLIYSHSQALAQCQQWLHKNYPQAHKIPVASTSQGVVKVLQNQEEGCGVICSKQSAHKAQLKILHQNIADTRDNTTFFAVITKKPNIQQGGMPPCNQSVMTPCNQNPKNLINLPKKNRTSILFNVKNEAGSLFHIPKEFAQRKINLTKLQARPQKNHIGDLIFFLDFQGQISDPSIQKTLKIIQQTAQVKILGEW